MARGTARARGSRSGAAAARKSVKDEVPRRQERTPAGGSSVRSRHWPPFWMNASRTPRRWPPARRRSRRGSRRRRRRAPPCARRPRSPVATSVTSSVLRLDLRGCFCSWAMPFTRSRSADLPAVAARVLRDPPGTVGQRGQSARTAPRRSSQRSIRSPTWALVPRSGSMVGTRCSDSRPGRSKITESQDAAATRVGVLLQAAAAEVGAGVLRRLVHRAARPRRRRAAGRCGPGCTSRW